MNTPTQHELEKAITDFWTKLSAQEKKDIGFNTSVYIAFRGSSDNLMEVVQEQVKQLMPDKKEEFQKCITLFNRMSPESQQAIKTKIVEYLIVNNSDASQQ